MPTRASKRKLEDFDPTKSDSNDEDYNAKTERAVKQKASRGSQRKRPKKRHRNDNDDDDDDDESELAATDEDSGDDSFEEEEPAGKEEVELDERTGRPKRSSTKKVVRYDVDDDSEEEEEEEQAEPKQKSKGRHQIIKLKLATKQPPSATSTRTARAGSMPRSRRGPSAETLSAGTRRSTRLHHAEDEPMVALSNSGNHEIVVRPGTQSPEGRPRRLTRGGKGVKAPTTSAIFEEEEETGTVRLNEPAEKTTSSPARRQPSDTAAPEGILSVEDSDPERVQEMQTTDPHALEEEHEAGENTAQAKDSEVEEHDEEDGEDDQPVSRGRRSGSQAMESGEQRRSSRTSRRQHKAGGAQRSSDHEFNPEEAGDEEDDMSSSEASEDAPRGNSQRHEDGGDESAGARISGRATKGEPGPTSLRRRTAASDAAGSDEGAELQEELEALRSDRPRRVRRSQIVFDSGPKKLRDRTKKPDYRIMRPENALPEEHEMESEPAPTPSRRGRGGAGRSWQRSLFSTAGPFGGGAGPPPVLGGGPGDLGAAGGVDSDSSDDEGVQRAPTLGGTAGMTPTAAGAPGLLPVTQTHGADPLQGPSGTPANYGRIKDKKALADIDPLGVDQNVNFDSVGGLKDYITQLKEMVTLPLLYPEVYQRLHATPPRGVLFHGPPGTGKTLMARALAASVSSEGQKITFYMRKGADILSKWVGEAERQLRMLFEDARAKQPSIIFFDEIDGLAPVRSSKQEQIHASIVSTLLALMDGMDGRGQVIVIGATNRPDAVDPALRRPGRFDREFYFPLPGKEARRSIIDIHTRGWEPALPDSLKNKLAELTKGYGGADIRALCTEAALNAVQRTYPQIYQSNKKLKLDPSKITVTARDFMMSIEKLVPSSERSSTSGAAPLPPQVEPLLREPLVEIQQLLSEMLPRRKKLTALEEAQYEEYHDPDGGFQREILQQDFDRSRIFRPRLVIRGLPGMGQQYIAKALLNHFEGLHVQSFELPALLGDSTRTPEAALVQLFTEVRRHQPSVIFLPNVDSWCRTVGNTVVTTFLTLLRQMAPTDPVLVLGIVESESTKSDSKILRELFGASKKNQFELQRPHKLARRAYFSTVIGHIRRKPDDFPDPELRKKRTIEPLEDAPPPPPPPPPTKEQLKEQRRRDHEFINSLQVRIRPIFEQMKKYRKFWKSPIEDEKIRYLYDEQDSKIVSTDQVRDPVSRPFEICRNKHGVPGLLEVATNKFYYNLNTLVIEERLAHGYYKRPKDFVADIRTLAKDAKTLGERDRIIRANELLASIEVDFAPIERDPAYADCENVYQREMARLRKAASVTAPEAEADTQSVLQIESTQPSLQPTQNPELSQQQQRQTTPTRRSQNGSQLSNGYPTAANLGERPTTQMSNGSSVPSRGDGGEMHDNEVMHHGGSIREAEQMLRESQPSQPVDEGMTSTQQVERSAFSYPVGADTQQNTQQRSQKTSLAIMGPGSQLDDFANSASPTTSGQRPSDHSHSNRSSDRWNTQSSNGVGPAGRGRDVPDYVGVETKGHGDSQLPDTQADIPSSSQGSASGGQHSSSQSLTPTSLQGTHGSQPPVPAFYTPATPTTGHPRPTAVPSASAPPPATTSIHAILNNPPQPAGGLVGSHHHSEYIIDSHFIDHLHENLTEKTSGCSIEQLEQINKALMDSVWNQRREWNRTKVGKEVENVFNDVMADIEDCQAIQSASNPNDVLENDDDKGGDPFS